MKLFIGLDDTDNHGSRGTGRLARWIAAELDSSVRLLGVTRHQLLVDPRIPYTARNSCACLLAEANGETDLPGLFEHVRALMLADFQPGSDPGLCLCQEPDEAISAFGRRVQSEIVTQEEARHLAANHGILLEGLGGTQDGVIGALAAVGLAAGGEDGRYIMVGRARDLDGLQPVEVLRQAGIEQVCTPDGAPVVDGLVMTGKLRPARRRAQPVLFVDRQSDFWQPLKID